MKKNKESEEDKSELIEILSDILEKILSTPTISHCKYFLLIKNLLIQEELHIYWKVKNQAKEKKAWTEVQSTAGEVYSSFKRRRVETIYISDWENVS